MTVNKDDIISALPNLSNADKKEIKNMLGFLLSGEDSNIEKTPFGGEELVWQAMCAQLAASGARSTCHYPSFASSVAFKSWKSSIGPVITFIGHAFGQTSKVEMLAVLNHMYYLLISEMRERGIPISLGTISSNTARLPEVFDKAFPGYIQAGLGRLVLDQMKRKVNQNG